MNKTLIRVVAILLGLTLPAVALSQGFNASRLPLMYPRQPMSALVPILLATLALGVLAATARWTSAGLLASGVWLLIGTVAVVDFTVWPRLLGSLFTLRSPLANSLYYGTTTCLLAALVGFGMGRKWRERAGIATSSQVAMLTGLVTVLLVAIGGLGFVFSIRLVLLRLMIAVDGLHWSHFAALLATLILVGAGFTSAWWRPSAALAAAMTVPLIIIYSLIDSLAAARLGATPPFGLNTWLQLRFSVGLSTTIPILVSWVILTVVGYRRPAAPEFTYPAAPVAPTAAPDRPAAS